MLDPANPDDQHGARRHVGILTLVGGALLVGAAVLEDRRPGESDFDLKIVAVFVAVSVAAHLSRSDVWSAPLRRALAAIIWLTTVDFRHVSRPMPRVRKDGRTSVFEMFSPGAQATTMAAVAEARALGDISVGPEHLLLAVHTQPAQPAAVLLSQLGATREVLVRSLRPVAPPPAGETRQRPRFTAQSKETFIGAAAAAQRLGDREINTGHLMLGLLRQPDGHVREVLGGLGIRSERADAVLQRRMAT